MFGLLFQTERKTHRNIQMYRWHVLAINVNQLQSREPAYNYAIVHSVGKVEDNISAPHVMRDIFGC